MKNLLKVSSLSVLAVLCTANAWATPVDYPIVEGTYFKSETDFTIEKHPGTDFVITSYTVRGDLCLPGYYCPEGSVDINGNRIFGVDSFPYNLVPCPDGTTSNAGAKSVDECFVAGPTLYNDTISESCKVDFLGSSSGNALNSFAAEYTPNTYTVSLHSNYGTDTVLGTVTATYDAAMPTATAPTRTGYTFGGFYDATTAGTQYYTSAMASAKTYDKTSDTNLYAYWDVNSHSITFSCGTMTGTIPNGTATYDSSYTFPTDSACEHTGYTFNGWGCSNDTTYTSGQNLTWNVDSDLTCTAQWTANTITISWDPNNGNPASTNQCTYDGDITLPTAPTKTGYTFSGWKLIVAPTQVNCREIDDVTQCRATPGCGVWGDGCYYVDAGYCGNLTESECHDKVTPSGYFCYWSGSSCVYDRIE